MEKTKYFFLFSTLILLTFTDCSRESSQQQPDLILYNGKVLTINPADDIAEAVAIKDDKILAVGTTAAIKKMAGLSTPQIDLEGKTVTPGLLDAHIHFGRSPWNSPNMLDLSYPNVKSIAEIKEKVAQMAQQLKPGEWIQGRGWDEGKLEERRLPTRNDLDEVAPNNPVWLTQTMGHYGTANSVALDSANISKNTSDPESGTIDRDANGNPTGVLKETAQRLVRRLIPSPSDEDVKKGIQYMTRSANAEGMTAVKDPTLNERSWKAYQELQASGDLNIRVFGLWPGGRSLASVKKVIEERDSMTQPHISTGDDHLISGGIKLFADGSGGARTAWMHEEWNIDMTQTDKSNYGYPNIDPDTLKEMIRLCHEADLHISTHAIGDRAIDVLMNAYKDALEAKPTQGLRHGIIHANIPTDKALQTMAELQQKYDAGYPEPSATFTWWIGDTYSGNFGERAKRLNPFATYQKMGIQWANGSDYSVTPFPARYGIWASIAREPALGVYGGDPFGRAEAVDVKTALRSVTIWAAHQLFLEDKIGSIETGKYADLAIWDRNPYEVATNDIKDMRCVMTIFNGKIVFQQD